MKTRVLSRTIALWAVLAVAVACAPLRDRVVQPGDLTEKTHLRLSEIRPPLKLSITQPEQLVFHFVEPVMELDKAEYDYSSAVVPATTEGLSKSFTLVDQDANTAELEIVFVEISGSWECQMIHLFNCSEQVNFTVEARISRDRTLLQSKELIGSYTAKGQGYFSQSTAFEYVHEEAARLAFSDLIAKISDFVDETIGIER